MYLQAQWILGPIFFSFLQRNEKLASWNTFHSSLTTTIVSFSEARDSINKQQAPKSCGNFGDKSGIGAEQVDDERNYHHCQGRLAFWPGLPHILQISNVQLAADGTETVYSNQA